MFTMDKRMTIGAKNLKIFPFIIFSVTVLMMNSEDLFASVIVAYITSLNTAPQNQSFSHIGKIGIRFGRALIQPSASLATVFMRFRGSTHKMNFTEFANILLGAASLLRSVITQSRTIFSRVATGGNVIENLPAHTTSPNKAHSHEEPLTLHGAILGGFKSMSSYIKLFSTMQTIFINPSPRFMHAIIQG
jgi:hypothetical protein